MTTRRRFLTTATAALWGVTAALFSGSAVAQDADTFETDSGEIVVHPVSHASLVMETPVGVIYVDPVGPVEQYDDLPRPDLILITHEHGDHFDPETLAAIGGPATQMVVNMAVYDALPQELKMKSQRISNGESTDALGVDIQAVPAYNITEGRLDYHPQGRDNGYLFEIDGRRIYIAGDSEGTEEMRGLEDIFLAFVPMNLPYTMDAEQAADAVAEFAPQYVYPYHYRGEDGGTQDPEEFARLLREAGSESEVRMGSWYEAAPN